MPDPLTTITDAPRHVLVTGCSGAIGAAAARGLIKRGHRVRGFDLRPAPDDLALDDMVTANLTDRPALDRAMRDIDTCIHLAANPSGRATWEELLEPNILGLHNVWEAALAAGVKRMIPASTVQVVLHENWTDHPSFTVDAPLRPRNLYAASKCFAEALAWAYHQRHGMELIIVRPGYFPRTAAELERIHVKEWGPRMYWSHDDAGRFYIAAVEAQPITAAILYGVSNHPNPVFDLTPARELINYQPRDTFPAGLPTQLP